MTFGIEAAMTQFDALLTTGSGGIVPLPGNLKKMDRNDTPHLVPSQVLFAHHYVGKFDWPEAMETGPVITVVERLELVLSRFMADGSIEGSAEYEAATRAIMSYARPIRHRFMQAGNWLPGTTGITLVRDFKMVGRGVKRQPWRLEYRFQFDVVIDEEPAFS